MGTSTSADTQKVETWALHPTDKYSPNVFYGRAPEPFTASLDAALALAERVLPGSDWNVCHEEGELKAHLWPRGTYIGGHEGVAQTPALALVAAILKAMIATQGEKT